ncbi:RNA polymerase-binding protein RbpA [Arthrobacter sp. H16F315]|uniref:RNA polymerase-binding protein RbpA n=1 Tax=Arthrobacter sp. H16F315 TaxID=2955314 RepID=UPI00406CE514
MLHSASGFRGTRVGATEGAPARHEPPAGAAARIPRTRVSYRCAKGHETALVFAQLPDEQIPGVWDCRHCGGTATRDETQFSLDDVPAEGYKSHLEYVKRTALQPRRRGRPGRSAGAAARPPILPARIDWQASAVE